ncbi:hypothetical protein D3C73_1445240 [compost metagenome]
MRLRRSATNTGVFVWPLCKTANAEKQSSRSAGAEGTTGMLPDGKNCGQSAKRVWVNAPEGIAAGANFSWAGHPKRARMASGENCAGHCGFKT